MLLIFFFSMMAFVMMPRIGCSRLYLNARPLGGMRWFSVGLFFTLAGVVTAAVQGGFGWAG